MGSYAVFVDAAYLAHSAARVLNRRSRELVLDSRPVVRWARELRTTAARGERLLRVYWYDGAFDPAHPDFRRQRSYFDTLEEAPGLVLRLGYVVERTPSWHRAVRHAVQACGVNPADFARHFQFAPERAQKGVDALLTLDLVHLAQKGAYDSAIVVAGDRDFDQAVATAQEEGRRVVLAVPSTTDVAPQLRRGADDVVTIDPATLASFFVRPAGRAGPGGRGRVSAPTPRPAPAPAPAS